MLEVLMTKNENNSHAFLRKMAENIKQTKDAQCPEDAKANEVGRANTPTWNGVKRVLQVLFSSVPGRDCFWSIWNDLNIFVFLTETVHRLWRSSICDR